MSRPIETAPQDGTVIWATSGRWMVHGCRMKWSEADQRWVAWFGGDEWKSVEPQPTQWIPFDPTRVPENVILHRPQLTCPTP